MHRLFVAIQPPRPIRTALVARMGGVTGARWQSDAQLHLTLRFIGEVDRHCARDVAAALATVHQARIAVTLEGIGQFDRRGRVDTLWIGAHPQAPLVQLHNKINQALARVGLEPEARAYRPHVTLARFSGAAGAIGGLVASAGAPLGPFEAEDYCLYESHLGSDGASYEVVERYPLR